MQIIGLGKVSSTVSGSNITYTAVPSKGYSLKYWSTATENYADNPLTVENSVEIVSVTFYYSILEYLKSMVAFEVPDTTLYSLLSKRGVSPQADIVDLDDKTKDLLYADVLIWGSTIPSTYGSVVDSDGGWTHQEGASTINAADKKRFESIANDIYRRYGETGHHADIRIVAL